MKIKIISNPITPYGDFSRGQELTDQKYPTAFLIHLVEQAGAAEYMDKEAYLNKVVHVEINKGQPTEKEVKELVDKVNEAVTIKKPQSSPLLPQAKASRKKTSKKHKKKQP